MKLPLRFTFTTVPHTPENEDYHFIMEYDVDVNAWWWCRHHRDGNAIGSRARWREDSIVSQLKHGEWKLLQDLDPQAAKLPVRLQKLVEAEKDYIRGILAEFAQELVHKQAGLDELKANIEELKAELAELEGYQ